MCADGRAAVPVPSSRPFDTVPCVCDIADMSDILTIRVSPEEKRRWRRAAERANESVADFVRRAIRQREAASGESAWDALLGSAHVTVPPPTNANVRRAFARRRRSSK